jgi:hypothetical protein
MHTEVTVSVHNLIDNNYTLYTNTHTLWYYDIDIITAINVQYTSLSHFVSRYYRLSRALPLMSKRETLT